MNAKQDKRTAGKGSRNSHRSKSYQNRDKAAYADRTLKASRESNVRDDNGGISRSNHPEWYSRYSSLVRDAARLPFSNPLGATIPGESIFYQRMWSGADEDFKAVTGMAVPGIMTFECLDVPGFSESGYSPINVAANALYSYVRHANSGSSTYDSSDLMLYVLACDSIYSLWAHAVRAYAAMTSYSYINRYFAKEITQALGFNYDAFADRLSDFRAAINNLAFRLGSLCVPGEMSVVQRHVYLYGTIFADSTTKKTQLYAYKPGYVWKYGETTNEAGGELIPVSCRQFNTLEEFINMYRQLTDAILTSEALMNMGGDIMKAYGSDKLQKVQAIPEVVTLNIMYDEKQAMEIQNTSITPLDNVSSLNILAEANTNSIIFKPVSKATQDVTLVSQFLNVRADDVTQDDVMKATRMMAFISDDGFVRVCGTEIVFEAWIWYNIKEEGASAPTLVSKPVRNYFFGQYDPQQQMLLERFDWHPYIYGFDDDTNRGFVFGDMDNYTLVDSYTLSKIHEAALFSEFYSPNMGNFLQE